MGILMEIRGEYFVIKPVDENDISDIFNVYKQCEDFLSLGPVSHASKQMVLDDLKLSKDEGGIFCGIFIGAEMIGIVDFVENNYESNPEEAYLSLLMIAKTHRNKGIGKDVVNVVESVIRKNANIKTILAGVQVNNKSAIDFWNKMGYKIVSGPKFMPDTTIVYDLKKDLT